MRFESLIPRSWRGVILWISLFLILCGSFFVGDYLDTSHVGEWREHRVAFLDWEKTYHVITHFTWAPWASIGLIIFSLYVGGIYLIYNHARQNERNVIRWITASIVFSPLIAGIAYLLTWPERKTKTGKVP